jgi:hypothetical protein
MCRQLEIEYTLESITVPNVSTLLKKFLPNLSLLGTLTKLQNATISFATSAFSPLNNLASTGWILMKFDI